MTVRATLVFSVLAAGCTSIPGGSPFPVAQDSPEPIPTLIVIYVTPAPLPTVLPTHEPPISAPTSASTPAPPSAATGTVDDKITIGDYQHVTLADAEYSSTGYNEFAEPDPGNFVYAFLMEFEGIDPEGSSYNPFYFDLIVDGFEYSATFIGKDPALQSGDLQPGATIRGWISFEAPAADEVTLVYEPVLGLRGDAVKWSVTVDR